MSIEIKHNILFFPDKERITTGTETDKEYKSDAKVRLRVRWNSKVVNFNVGIRIKLEQWDETSQRCKRRTTNLKQQSASLLNAKIQHYENIVEDVFKSFELEGKIPDVGEYRVVFNSKLGKVPTIEKVDHNIFQYIDIFANEEGHKNAWSPATYQKFRTLKQHLIDFKVDLVFSDFNEEGLLNYLHFLRDVKAMRNSTIKKQLSFLKWFLRWATKKNINCETTFLTFTPKLKTTDKKVIFLTWEELMHVYAYRVPQNKGYLERVRDVFCFTCFTSLRYSDVANLKRTSVFKDYIEVVTVKTSDSLKIELNDYSQEILSKYKDETFVDDMALPVISNQRMNEYLKELGELCEIDAPINVTYYKGNVRYDESHPKYALLGTHAGRRTFICNALMMGIPPQTVMKWTGHSDYKAMKPYIDIADKEKENAMKLFNRR